MPCATSVPLGTSTPGQRYLQVYSTDSSRPFCNTRSRATGYAVYAPFFGTCPAPRRRRAIQRTTLSLIWRGRSTRSGAVRRRTHPNPSPDTARAHFAHCTVGTRERRAVARHVAGSRAGPGKLHQGVVRENLGFWPQKPNFSGLKNPILDKGCDKSYV
ncbi:hypothetical protein C8R45DRAFT_932343 [Mycena sanguinolenta]|nr:hypothetical protein C8R45DRAFT_932343 [Mycena sanguinolenta]